MKFSRLYVHCQCELISKCFIRSVTSGYDSEDFVKQFMTSSYGVSILDDSRISEYADANFMFEGLERNLTLKKGYCYDIDSMEYAGYLYKYWISTRDILPTVAYKIGSLKRIVEMFAFYHTQDWDYVINDLIEYYNKTGVYS